MASRRNALIVRARSIPARLVNRVQRLMAVADPSVDEFSAGADFAIDSPVGPSYSVANSMSAMGAFPWVRACVMAKAEDMAGLALKVTRGRGESAVEVDDHPLLDLMAQPSTREMWETWMRQAMVDLELVGNIYQVMLGFPTVPSLLRLHPQRTLPVPDKLGQAQAYNFDGKSTYAYEDVMHVRHPSWEDGPVSIIGEGSIRCLHEDLTADLMSKRMTAKASERGRLEVMISPINENQTWGDPQVAAIREKYLQLSESGRGALIVGGAAKVDTLSSTPREQEFIQSSINTRAAILAVMGVPPTRVGLPGANYATDRQQMRLYWEGLVSRGKLVASGLTRVAWALTGDRRDRVSFVTSQVEALQNMRTEALGRVSVWVDLGATPAQAAAYEGFDDAPVPDEPLFSPFEAPEIEDAEEVDTDADEVDEDEEDTEDVDRSFLPVTEAERKAAWHVFIKRVQRPAENLMRRETGRFLREQKKRLADRLGQALEQQPEFPKAAERGLVQDVIDLVMSQEATRTRSVYLPMIRQVIERAFQIAITELGLDLSFEPDRSEVVKFTESLVKKLGRTTAEVIRRVVNRGLEEGATIAQIQSALQRSGAFSPSRALRIARTEATKAVNAGAIQAYKAAGRTGVKVERQWLTARDGLVRNTHQTMDGQTRDLRKNFDSPSGASAPHPGGFGVAGEDINCRCTVVPVVAEAE